MSLPQSFTVRMSRSSQSNLPLIVLFSHLLLLIAFELKCVHFLSATLTANEIYLQLYLQF